MKDLMAHALRVQNRQLSILNQQKLPQEEEWIKCLSPDHMCEMIRSLQVRGAPLIGIAAAIALAQYATCGALPHEIKKAAAALRAARPTAVNLMHCIDRQMLSFEKLADVQNLVAIAEELFFEDVQLCEKIAFHGNTLLTDGDHILTHCNTGALVTVGCGTALGIIFHAHKQEKQLHVYVDETRPLLQGGRLTTWELNRWNIPYTLICDNMAATLMRAGKIQKIIVGADRIAQNGDFANKIGTYNLAVLAHYHQIPFYVAAPYTTIDLHCVSGEDIVVEERSADEVRGFVNNLGTTVWSVSNSPVFNPAFDVTPAHLVTAFILDRGIYKPSEFFENIQRSKNPNNGFILNNS